MAWTISRTLYEHWNSSQAQAAESSADICSERNVSAPLNTTPTPDQFYWPDKTTEHSRLSRFGMTCVPLTESHGEALLTWFREAFPARTLAPQEKVQELKGSEADFGEKWSESFARYDRHSCVWKTHQCSLLEEWEPCLEIFPRWGLMRGGELFPLKASEHLTSGRGYGFMLPTPSGCSNSGKNHVAGRLDEWGGSSNPWRGTEIGKISCPAFEEWVMGWPVQWTALMPLETAKFLEWLQQHGES